MNVELYSIIQLKNESKELTTKINTVVVMNEFNNSDIPILLYVHMARYSAGNSSDLRHQKGIPGYSEQIQLLISGRCRE